MNHNFNSRHEWMEDTLDTEQLDALAEQHTRELMSALISHILRLQEDIVCMRKNANDFSAVLSPDRPAPYPELYADLCPSFADFIAYETFKDIIQLLE